MTSDVINNSAVNQLEFDVNASNIRPAEETRVQGMIGFSFVSDWLRKSWRAVVLQTTYGAR